MGRQGKMAAHKGKQNMELDSQEGTRNNTTSNKNQAGSKTDKMLVTTKWIKIQIHVQWADKETNWQLHTHTKNIKTIGL